MNANEPSLTGLRCAARRYNMVCTVEASRFCTAGYILWLPASSAMYRHEASAQSICTHAATNMPHMPSVLWRVFVQLLWVSIRTPACAAVQLHQPLLLPACVHH
jgi:hypothetical protein